MLFSKQTGGPLPTKDQKEFVAFCIYLKDSEAENRKLFGFMMQVSLSLGFVAGKSEERTSTESLAQLQKKSRLFIRASKETPARQHLPESIHVLANALANVSAAKRIADEVYPLIRTFPGSIPPLSS